MPETENAGKQALSKLLSGMERIREQKLRILREMVENSNEVFEAVQAMADESWGALDYLCNFDSITSQVSGNAPISEPIERLKDLISDAFERLTGRDYIPESVRKIKRQNGLKQ